MFKTITAGDISRKAALVPYERDKGYIVTIDATTPFRMIYEQIKGNPGGIRWLFVCPITGKRCCKLHLIGNTYQHSTAIKGYYRKVRPVWITESPLDAILIKKQRSIDAENLMDQKYFKTNYAGKSTKKYLKCLERIKAAAHISMHDIINGHYEKQLRSRSNDYKLCRNS